MTAGTIFDRNRISLEKWFSAAWYLAELSGISALDLQRQLRLGSYETAWKMLHKLRSAMRQFLRRRLRGSVAVDLVYVGGPQKGVEGSETNQRLVVGIAAVIVTPGDRRYVRLAHIPDDSSDSLLRFVCEVVEPGCHVHTDKIADKRLRDCGYRHGGVKGDPAPSTGRYGPDFEAWWRSQFQVGNKLTKLQADAYLQVRGRKPPLKRGSNDPYSVQALLPWTSRVSSELEAWLSRTHRGAGAIAGAHLGAYLDEYSFRINCRRKNRPGMLFRSLLRSAMRTSPTRYRRSRSRQNC